MRYLCDRLTRSALLVMLLTLLLLMPASAHAAKRQPDFNGDGFADLAVGVPGEDFTPPVGFVRVDAGAVNVFDGGVAGPALNGAYWNEASLGGLNSPAANERFGSSLAWGDFNGDGYSDIAIGAPGEFAGAGVAFAIYGSGIGLDPVGVVPAQQWSEGVGFAEAGHRCGFVVTVGDFDNDGYDDLAVGCPNEGVNGQPGAGAAFVVYGSINGLDAMTMQHWHQDVGAIIDMCEAGDHFSQALTTGDFNGDGFDDLAVGVPGEDLMGVPSAGAVNVILGSAAGLTDIANEFWNQGLLAGALGANDHFGSAVAAGDFNGDGFDDLAVGVPDETGIDAGAVNVVWGSALGLDPAVGDQLFHENVIGIAGDGAQANDHFGTALAAGDFNADGLDDLAIGIPGEDIGAIANAGSITLLPGSAAGLTVIGSESWDQSVSADAAEAGDFYGSTLAVGDYNNDGHDDLTGGSPGDDSPGGVVDAGGAVVFLGDAAGALLTNAGNVYREQNGVGDAAAEAGDSFGAGVYGP